MSSMRRCVPAAEPPDVRRRRIRPLWWLVVAIFAAAPAAAEERVVVQGLADMEGWRHEDEPSGLARARLWASASFTDHLQGFALTRISGGSADDVDGAETDLEQAWLQHSFAPQRRLLVRAGRLLQPVGGFAARYLSSRNPRAIRSWASRSA
jgi:hypothetical protein